MNWRFLSDRPVVARSWRDRLWRFRRASRNPLEMRAPQGHRLAFGPRSFGEVRAGALHLFVLSAFAVAQPLFAIFRQSPEFFVARRVDGGDLVAFALLLLVIPPALAMACVLAAGAVRPRWYLHALR
ncbi:MAG: hypothetical protein M3252_00390, partial [Actinomycetota bacterium]|nr:hypothetical protein [Actinomycetota bacterium]